MKKGRKGKQVVKIDFATGEELEIYLSSKEAGLENYVSPQNICYVCNGKRNEAGGFKWRWLDDKLE